MISDTAQYGVYAPLVAIISSIMAAGSAIVVLWAGPLEKWRPPDADLPGMAKRIIFLACSVVMVLLVLDATPENLGWMKQVAAWALVTCVILGIVYSALRFSLYHSRLAPNGTSRKIILGGLWLKSEAKKSMKKHNLSEIDDLLDGAPGLQAVWSGQSRFFARILILGFFILFVVTATVPLIEVGLITYVKTTGKTLFK